MGARKRLKANAMKEARKTIAFAKLNNCPTSPRKMRLIADLIRGMDADKALSQLKLNPKVNFSILIQEKLCFLAV